MKFGIKVRTENQETSEVLNVFPSGVAIFVAVNSHLLQEGVVSLDLNDIGLEQMSDNKDKHFPYNW